MACAESQTMGDYAACFLRLAIVSGLLVLFGCAEGSDAAEGQAEEDAGPQSRFDAHVTPDSEADARLAEPESLFGSDVRPFPEATFVGSEETVLNELLGSLKEQLSAGIRYLQLPIHDNGFRERGDYALGLDEPRDQLNAGGDNPSRENLSDWLEHIALWSDEHPGHAPITVAIDLRDDLSDNANYNEGDLHRLNGVLTETLGEKLFAPPEVDDGAWPTVDMLRGKVMVVLSGHETSRTRYREAQGARPAIAGDQDGELVMVHEVGFAELRYWVGARDGAGVTWKRSGEVRASLVNPAIAMNDEGLLVLVGTSPPTQEFLLTYIMIGELLPTGAVFWREAEVLGTGSSALVRFPDPTKSKVEILIDPETPDAQMYEVSVRRNDGATSIDSMEQTDEAAWDHDVVRSDNTHVRVFADEGGVLRYETEVRRRAVAPEQLAFTEYAKGEHATLQRWFRFSDDLNEVQTWLAQGLIVRAPYSEAVMSLEQQPTIIVDPEPFSDVLAPFLELPEEDQQEQEPAK